MQLVGRPFAEDLILRVGNAFQRATEWHRREPSL
jgi:aspartyl-tRNA(Asn)/glutamyl-tRNA(Gln) amidotransferase subunit A